MRFRRALRLAQDRRRDERTFSRRSISPALPSCDLGLRRCLSRALNRRRGRMRWMRRLLRILFNASAMLSLLLFLATLVLWVRSPRHLDRVSWIGADHEQVRACSVWTLNGRLVLTNRLEPL